MRRLILRTVLPALLAIGLFSGVVFFYFLPTLSRAVLDQKRLMIRELTESAWNILARFEAEERSGRLARAQAQAAAIAQVRSLHYGQEGKDYFWINDMQPRMIVHPYRPDLEGNELSGFTDRRGKHMFLEMVRVVQQQGAGYVAYMWQWKDHPERVVPKLSYVKGFSPWGWIIGTGVYTDDVDTEVAAVSSGLRTAALLILGIVSALMISLLRTSVQSERGRIRAAAALRESEEKYRSLVEAAGESIFMSIGGERLYANASMLRLVGYDHEAFSKLRVSDVLRPTAAELETGRSHWQSVADGIAAPTRYEAELLTRSGNAVRVMLSLSRIVVQGRAGFMAVATQLPQPRELDVLTVRSTEDLAAANRSMSTMASLMMVHGAEAMQISRMLSLNAEAVVRKAVELLFAELGPAPVPFDILLMGSLGRREVTLRADQDHAIVFSDSGDAEMQDAREYFMRLGTRLSDVLDAAGYRYCPGGIMSGNANCCQTLSEWRRTFSSWIRGLEANDLLQTKIFFDYRSALHGSDLIGSLTEHLRSEIRQQTRFIHLLARSLLEYQPPINAFGGFILEDELLDQGSFNVKGVIAQIVDFARLRALQHDVHESSTVDRLNQVAAAGHLREATRRDLLESFQFLTTLRMDHQASQVLNRLEPDNRIVPAKLDPETRSRLKGALGHIKVLQAVLDHEFKGAP